MGNKKQSELRRAENEVAFRAQNEAIQSQAARLLPDANRGTFRIAFTCECSDENCRDKIKLTISQFRRYHRNPKRFILLPGHEHTDVEQVIAKHPRFVMVEKYEVPPTTDGLLNKTS